MVRAPEPGTTNLGEFVANNACELARVFAVDAVDLQTARAIGDAELAPHVVALLRRQQDQAVVQEAERRRERSLRAATQLGTTARWAHVGAVLDVDLLLGELLADRSKKWVSFREPSGFVVTVPIHLIAAARPLQRLHIGLAACVDSQGLHLRWRGGRGGYNWRPHDVHRSLEERVLTVSLAPRFVLAPARRRGGAWIHNILSELGYL